MKKTERARSHSWWWDSHVSSINSKWLQENVAEMNAKVAAMLTIIEEEADSFAQRAEMFYRKRPELISLLGEFHQNYRALVERHDHLNKEIRLKVAPDLQAQLGVSLESAQNSPTDLGSRRGIDGFDAVSPSYSYPGQSEFDSDSPSARAHTDEDDLSPLPSRTNNLSRTFGFKSKFPGFHDDVTRSGSEPITADVSQLQRDLKHYQEENKALIADVAKLKTMQFEFSSMQTRLRNLEVEDKNSKKKLKSCHEQGQKLEAENLKLNHSLTALKQEKAELAEQCTKEVEEACQRNKHLESEIIAFKQQLADIESLKAEHLEKIKEAEASKQKLQDALTSLQEESEKDLAMAKEALEQQIHDLQKKILALEEENQKLRDEIEMKASAATEMENELQKLITYRNDLEQLFFDSEKERDLCQHEKLMAETNARELKEELKLVQKEKENITEKSEKQAGEIERLMEIVHNLEKDRAGLEASKIESANLILKLESDIEQGIQVKESLATQYNELKEKYESLEAAEIKLKEHITSCSSEISLLKDEKLASESMITRATLEIEELQLSLSSSSAEKGGLKDALEKALEQARNSDEENQKMHMEAMAKASEASILRQELVNKEARLKALEDDLHTSITEKYALEASKVEATKLILKLESEIEKGVQARESVEAQYKESKEKCESLEAAEQKLKEQIASNSSDISLLKDEKLALQSMFDKASKEIMELKLDLSSLSGEKEAIKETLEKALKEKDVIEASKAESEKHILQLESNVQEVVRARETLAAQYKEVKEKCEYLEVTESKLKERVASNGLEISFIKDEKLAFESMAAKLGEEIKELKINLSSLSAEKETIKEALEKSLEEARRSDEEYQRIHKEAMAKEAEATILKQELVTQEARLKSLQDDLHSSLKEKDAIEERNLQALSELEKEQRLIQTNLESKLATAELKISSLETERTNLTVAIQELEQKCSSLQQQNGELNEICRRAQSDHQIATEVSHKLQEELAILLITEKSLQSEDRVKAEIIEKLKNEVKTLEEQIQNSKEVNILLVRQNQDGTRQVADFEAQLKELKLTLSQTSAAHASVVDQLSEKERSNELLNQEISDLHAQIVALNSEISSRTSHEHGLVDQINVLKEKGDSLSANLGECSMRKNHLEVQVEELNQACLAEKEENKALLLKQQKYLDEIATMKMNHEELQKNLHHLTEERLLLLGEAAAHLKQHKDMEQTISGLESNVEVMKGENLSLKDQLVKAQEEKKIIGEDNAKAKLEIHDLLRKLSDLDGRNTNLLSEVQNKGRDISTLEAEIGLLRNTNSSLAKEVALLQEDQCISKDREESLSSDLQKSLDVTQNLMKDIEKLNQTLFQSEAKIDDLQREIDLLTEDRANLTRNIGTHLEKHNELDAHIRGLQSEKGVLERDIVAAVQRGDGLKEEVLNHVNEKKELIRIIESLKSDMTKKDEDLKSVEQEKKSIMDKLNLTVDEKDALDNKYTELRKDLEQKNSEAIRAIEHVQKMQAEILQLKQDNAITEDALNLAISEKDALAKKYEDLLLDLEKKKTEATMAIEEQLKVQSELLQLKQDNSKTLDSLNLAMEEKDALTKKHADLLKELEEKRSEATTLTAELLKMQTVKEEIEKQLHLSSSHAERREMEIQRELADMQQEHARLEEMSVVYRRDAENTILQSSEEIRRQREDNELMKKDLFSIAEAKRELEQTLDDVQKKKEAVDENLVAAKKELETTQRERDRLQLNVEHGLQLLNEKAKEAIHLQERLESLEANKLVAEERQSKMNDEWNSRLRSVEKRVEDLNSEILKSQNELVLQQQKSMKLNEEIAALQAEKESLEREKSLLVDQLNDLEKELEGLKFQLHERDETVQRFSSQAETLRKSLSSIEEECLSLKKFLQNDKDSHDAAMKTKADETSSLETKLAEARHNFAVQEKLVSELQNRVAGLTEEKDDMTFKLENSLREIMQLKAVIKDLQDVELKEVHDRVLQLQDQSKSITASHEEKVAENASLRGQVEEHIVTVSRVEEENRRLKSNLADQAAVLEKLRNEHSEKILQLQNESKSSIDSYQVKLSEMEEAIVMLKNRLSVQETESGNLTRELDARILKLQNESKSIAASHQEKAVESDFLRGQMQEHMSRVSKLEKEKMALATELDSQTEILLRTTEEHKLSVKDAELLLLQVEELQMLLDKSEEDNNYTKMQAKNAAEEVNQLKDEIQKLQLQIQTEYEQESRAVPTAEVDFREKVPVQESGNHRGIPLSEEKLEDTGAERIRREADSASEIDNAQKLSYDLHSKADRMEEENTRARKEVETLRMENKKLYAMLTDWQGKDIGWTLRLRENLLTLCERIGSVAKELQDGDGDDGRKFQECAEKLDAMQKGGSDSSTPVEKGELTEYGRLVSGDMNVDSLQVRTSEVELAMMLVLMQHQERVKEVVMLQEAVGTLRTALRKCLDRATPQPSMLERPRSPSIQSRRSNPSTPERTGAKDVEETDVIIAAKEILQEEYEALETRSIEGEDELRGLARLHINLGTRLHQVLMDEKLEVELMGLKEERKKLREDLQARVEEVEKMEAELGALQRLVREGNERQGAMDPRQKKQWAEKRRIAEAKVERLSEELVLQRQQVSNMKETVLSWAEEQEAATEELEEQVLDLVSKESAPTMDGWDDEHVEKLMEKMKSYKALTRRHSLDLQSVERSLMRVSSTIEFTQRQLLVRPDEEEEEEDDDDDEGGTSVERSDADFPKSEVSSGIGRDQKVGGFGRDQKVRGFGRSWFLLLCRAEKKAALSSGNRSSSIKAKKKLGCWN